MTSSECPFEESSYYIFCADVQVELQGSTLSLSILSVLAIITALQTTVLLIVVICKYRRKRGKAVSKGAIAGADEVQEQVYEILDPEDRLKGSKPPIKGQGKREAVKYNHDGYN